MGWRIISIKSRAKLDYKMNYLVVRTESKTSRVLLDEILLLMVESTAVSLTSYLLSELVKKKIKVIFCDELHNPQSDLVPLYGSHDDSRKIREQITWDPSFKAFLHAEIVRIKISGQIANLPPACERERALLTSYLSEIQPGDATNREGHAAKVYFNALFGLDFTRGTDSPINAALNYGYGILLAAFNREIVASGYLTQLGIFHDNMFNHFNLSCDLMEPFRPFIDRFVMSSPPTAPLTHEDKMKLLDLLNQTVSIRGQNNHLSTAIHLWISSVWDALRERDLSCLESPCYG